MKLKNQPRRAVSLFSNCGAGDVGYAKAGFQFEVMAELVDHRMKVCSLNHSKATPVPGDLRETWRDVVKAYWKRAGKLQPALLAACPPCQGMSSARTGRGKEEDAEAGLFDDRNLLVTVIAKVARSLKPQLIVVENVQAFLTKKIPRPYTKKPISAARYLIDVLDADYAAFPISTDLCDFGVPQSRKRSFLTFVRRDLKGAKQLLAKSLSPYPKPSHARDHGGKPVTLREALEAMGLPSLDASTEELAYSADPMHFVPVWRDHRYPMVQAIPFHMGGTAWENNRCSACGPVNAGPDDATCPTCNGPLLRPVMKTETGYRLVNGFRTSSYSRMKSDEPAATVTTASGHIGSDHTIHPFENRLLSARECQFLQTFPKNFKWGEALDVHGVTNVRDMIGEAVPPMFTEKHGRVLMQVLRGHVTKRMLGLADNRVRTARKKLSLDKRANGK